MGTSGSQRRGFRRTRAGAGGVPAVGGRGGVLVPQVARSAVSALRGWSGEPQKSVEIRWIGIGVVRGWSPPRTGQVCERISAQTPWIHPESKIRSELGIVKASCGSGSKVSATTSITTGVVLGALPRTWRRAGGRRGSPAARRKWLPRWCRREPRREAAKRTRARAAGLGVTRRAGCNSQGWV